MVLVFQVPFFLIAQNYSKNWAMSLQTTLTFDGASILSSSNSLNIGGGRVSLSDQNGDLLFYSDLVQVYDAMNNPMLNGDFPLLSSQGAIQSIPFLTDSNLYWRFASSDSISTIVGLTYSIIDMTMNAGLGDIPSSQKNIVIDNDQHSFSLGLTAHRNGKRAWLASSKENSNIIDFRLVGDSIELVVSQMVVSAGTPLA